MQVKEVVKKFPHGWITLLDLAFAGKFLRKDKKDMTAKLNLGEDTECSASITFPPCIDTKHALLVADINLHFSSKKYVKENLKSVDAGFLLNIVEEMLACLRAPIKSYKRHQSKDRCLGMALCKEGVIYVKGTSLSSMASSIFLGTHRLMINVSVYWMSYDISKEYFSNFFAEDSHVHKDLIKDQYEKEMGKIHGIEYDLYWHLIESREVMEAFMMSQNHKAGSKSKVGILPSDVLSIIRKFSKVDFTPDEMDKLVINMHDAYTSEKRNSKSYCTVCHKLVI